MSWFKDYYRERRDWQKGKDSISTIEFWWEIGLYIVIIQMLWELNLGWMVWIVISKEIYLVIDAGLYAYNKRRRML